MDSGERIRRELNNLRSQQQEQRELTAVIARQCAAQIAALARHLEYRESEFAESVRLIRMRKAFRLALLVDRIRRRVLRGLRSVRPSNEVNSYLEPGDMHVSLLADDVVSIFSRNQPISESIAPNGGAPSAVRLTAALVRHNETASAQFVADALFRAYPGVVTPEWTAALLSELRIRGAIRPAKAFVSAAVRRWPDHASIRFEAAAFSDTVGDVNERIANWKAVLDVVTEADIATIRTTAEDMLEALETEPETIASRALDPLNSLQYMEWIRKNEDHSVSAFDRWSAAHGSTKGGPTFSIVMPVHNPDIKFLTSSLNSIVDQWYPHWELVICDDGSQNGWFGDVAVGRLLEDNRISVIFREQNGGVSAATNDAIRESVGEWITFMDQHDLLSPDALAQFSVAIADEPRAQLLYSDEDQVDEDGNRFMPYFKPRLVRELLIGQNVVNHLSVLGRAIVTQAGGFRSEFDGAQSWDLMLRVFEMLEDYEVVHVPRICYHSLASPKTIYPSESTTTPVYGAGLRAVREAVNRRGLQAAVRPCHDGSWFQVSLRPSEPWPPISIIVPTRDHPELLIPCVESALSVTRYVPFELIIMDNGTCDVEALQFLESVKLRDNVTVVPWDRPFNFSELLNEGVRRASGDIVVSLNNDVIVHQEDWLAQFAGHLQREGVGAVGARLLYADCRVQHGGVLIGLGGVAGHSYCGAEAADFGYFGQAILNREVEAVTAAVMAVRRDVFIAHGGFDEENLPIAYNDVDFCLRLRRAGMTNIQLATVELTHLESKSRGSDHRPNRRQGFAAEVDYMKRSWGRDDGSLVDRIRNPNFVQHVGDRLLAPWAQRLS